MRIGENRLRREVDSSQSKAQIIYDELRGTKLPIQGGSTYQRLQRALSEDLR